MNQLMTRLPFEIKYYFIICLHHVFFTLLSADKHSAILKNIDENIGEHKSLCDRAHIGYISTYKTIGLYDCFAFYCSRNIYTFGHGIYFILYLHQTCTWLVISPYICQHLLFSVIIISLIIFLLILWELCTVIFIIFIHLSNLFMLVLFTFIDSQCVILRREC